ncbi:hypothetical protein JYT48_01970 [Mariprofundus ferrooxydans]|nr:hypothetical protein [Mariprofundus ferrooxydans]
MKTEISRNSRQAKKRYSGVYQQQGRMFTDSDVNEQVDINKQRLNSALGDMIVSGIPRDGGLSIVSDASVPDIKIRSGRFILMVCPPQCLETVRWLRSMGKRISPPFQLSMQTHTCSMPMSGNGQSQHWKITACSMTACTARIPARARKPCVRLNGVTQTSTLSQPHRIRRSATRH